MAVSRATGAERGAASLSAARRRLSALRELAYATAERRRCAGETGATCARGRPPGAAPSRRYFSGAPPVPWRALMLAGGADRHALRSRRRRSRDVSCRRRRAGWVASSAERCGTLVGHSGLGGDHRTRDGSQTEREVFPRYGAHLCHSEADTATPGGDVDEPPVRPSTVSRAQSFQHGTVTAAGAAAAAEAVPRAAPGLSFCPITGRAAGAPGGVFVGTAEGSGRQLGCPEVPRQPRRAA